LCVGGYQGGKEGTQQNGKERARKTSAANKAKKEIGGNTNSAKDWLWKTNTAKGMTRNK
jgi:hypothetical protein